MPDEKLPPQNIEAEEAVIGSCLIDRDAIACIVRSLRPADFYREKNGWIYEAIVDLYNRHEPADMVTLCEELERHDRLSDCGGLEYLTTLLNAVPTAINVEYYANIVKRHSIKRQLIRVAAKLAGLGFDDAVEPGDALLQLKVMAADVRLSDTRIQSMAQIIPELQDLFVKRQNNPDRYVVKTGYPALDSIVRLGPGTMTIIAARPSVGKSALAANIMYQVAQRGDAVVYMSLEMTTESLTNRLIALKSGYANTYITGMAQGDPACQDPIADTAILEAMKRLMVVPMYIDDKGTHTLASMMDHISSVVTEHDGKLAIIDYLQLMGTPATQQGKDSNRVQELSVITRQLRQMAKDLHIPIIVLSQLNRSIEQRDMQDGLIPYRLSDLRESGSIEQDADIVLFLDRPHKYNAREHQMTYRDGRHLEPVRVVVAKNRNGKVGEATLLFHDETVEFIAA